MTIAAERERIGGGCWFPDALEVLRSELLQHEQIAGEMAGRVADHHHGLAVEEHIARLRDQLLPLVERAHRTARESIEAIRRTRQVPAMRVERAEAVNIRLVAP